MNDLNHNLLYFSEEFNEQLDQDKLIEIVDQAKNIEWYEVILNTKVACFD
jgi:hypothetical protein